MRRGTILVTLGLAAVLPAQAIKLRDIHPTGDSRPRDFTALRSTILFTAEDPARGRELWRTDGTVIGTTLVKDIQPGPRGSNPRHLTLLGNKVYFSADDGLGGNELWSTDGTNAGTKLVKNIAPGANGSAIAEMIVYKDRLFFPATDGTTGIELWESDGTAAGTKLVKDLVPGSASSQPTELTLAHNVIYFTANVADAGGNRLGRELCRSNGTSFGTLLFRDLVRGPGSSNPTGMTGIGNTLYFRTAKANTNGFELWQTNGLAFQIHRVTDRTVLTDPIGSAGRVWFLAEEPGKGRELFASDGSQAGTGIFADLNPGASSSDATPLAVIDNRLLFRAFTPGHGLELWRTDGTPAGTTLVEDIEAGTASGIAPVPGLKLTSGHLVFVGTQERQGPEPWVTNGTAHGTWRIQDIHPGRPSREPSDFYAGGGLLLFAADDGQSGREPWAMRLSDITDASFVEYGSGCRGSGRKLAEVLSNNKNGGILTGPPTPQRSIYAIEAGPAAIPMTIHGYEILTHTLSGEAMTVPAALHLADGNGLPERNPIATGNMRVDAQPGFCRVLFSQPARIPARKLLYLMVDAEILRLPRVRTGGGREWVVRLKSSSTWIRSHLVSRWSYRLLSSQSLATAPRLRNEFRPRIGKSYFLTLDSAKARTSAVLVTGISEDRWGSFALPLDLTPFHAPGCQLLASAEMFDAVAVDSIGGAELHLLIPNDSLLVGLPLYHQWLVLDAAANGLGVAFSEAGRAAIGR